MKRYLPLFVLLAGCAGGGGRAAAPESARPKVDRWLAAALRAHGTRTHATGEHPAAQAEMRRIEEELRREDRARAVAAVEEALVDVRDCRRECEGRRSSILVQGRGLSPEEQKEAERLGLEAETFRLSEEFLRDLRRKVD